MLYLKHLLEAYVQRAVFRVGCLCLSPDTYLLIVADQRAQTLPQSVYTRLSLTVQSSHPIFHS